MFTRHYKLQWKTPSRFKTRKTFGKQVLSIEACHFENNVHIYIYAKIWGQVLKVWGSSLGK